MAIIGIQINRDNPEFTAADFCFWMPQFSNYLHTEEGQVAFENLYEIANNKIYKSIYGTDWKMAMSLCIAHYLQLIANQLSAPSGDSLASIAGGGNYKGILSSATVGNFTKQYELSATLVEDNDSKFWNQTSYGAQLMALLKTKAIPSIMVVTSHNVPGAN